MILRVVPTFFVCLALVCAASADDLLFDFEEERLSSAWDTGGSIECSRQPLPPDALADLQALWGAPLRPEGSGVHLRANRGAAFYTHLNEVPSDWTNTAEVVFWVYRSPAEGERVPSSTLEVQLVEGVGPVRFWSKLEVSHVGWERVALPVKWFRWSVESVPRLDRIDRLAFYFRDTVDIWIDRVSTTPGPGLLSVDDLVEVAFPDAPQATRTLIRDDLWLLSDAADLDLEALAANLERAEAALRQAVPALGAPFMPPAVVVFAHDHDYRAFPVRMGARLQAQARAPQSDGYTLRRCATTSFDPEAGADRPVIAHEFVHAYLSCTARLPNRGDWVQEGLATYVQLQLRPQASLARVVQRGLRDDAQHLPLEQVASGERLPLTRYWQALTLIETLLARDNGPDVLARLLEAFGDRGNTDLGPLLTPVLGTDWDGLREEWIELCNERYGQ